MPTTCTQPMALQTVLNMWPRGPAAPQTQHQLTAAVVLHYISSSGILAPKIYCALLCCHAAGLASLGCNADRQISLSVLQLCHCGCSAAAGAMWFPEFPCQAVKSSCKAIVPSAAGAADSLGSSSFSSGTAAQSRLPTQSLSWLCCCRSCTSTSCTLTRGCSSCDV